jgi:hypothetical protein
MANTLNYRAQIRPEPGSLTTHRCFTATAASLGAVSLYGLWTVPVPRRAWTGWACPSGLRRKSRDRLLDHRERKGAR